MIDRSTPGVVLFTGFDQPDVEVLVDGDWCEGELRSWRRDKLGVWWADVQWRRGPGRGNYLSSFHQDNVRRAAPDTDR